MKSKYARFDNRLVDRFISDRRSAITRCRSKKFRPKLELMVVERRTDP